MRCGNRGLSWRWGRSWLMIVVWGRHCRPSPASGSLFSWYSWGGIEIRLIGGRCPWPDEVLTVSCCRCPQLHNLSSVSRWRLPRVYSRSWCSRVLATEVRRIDQRGRTYHHSPYHNTVNFSKPLETNHEIKVVDISSDSTPTPLCLRLSTVSLYFSFKLFIFWRHCLKLRSYPCLRKASTIALYGTTFLTDSRSWH